MVTVVHLETCSYEDTINDVRVCVCVLQDQAVNSDHQWVETNASGDYCYAMDLDCKVGFVPVCVFVCLSSACLPSCLFVCRAPISSVFMMVVMVVVVLVVVVVVLLLNIQKDSDCGYMNLYILYLVTLGGSMVWASARLRHRTGI